jgi:hypothetical protein
MKIHQLVSGYGVPVTNEEQQFIKRHGDSVKLTTLDEHDLWLAQGIVRKGLYNVDNDNVTLIKKSNEKSS